MNRSCEKRSPWILDLDQTNWPILEFLKIIFLSQGGMTVLIQSTVNNFHVYFRFLSVQNFLKFEVRAVTVKCLSKKGLIRGFYCFNDAKITPKWTIKIHFRDKTLLILFWRQSTFHIVNFRNIRIMYKLDPLLKI